MESNKPSTQEFGKDTGQEGSGTPRINFPDDINIVRALQYKLSEYKRRLATQLKSAPYKAPEIKEPEIITDTNYKIAVLEALLTKGEVDTHQLSRELNEKFNGINPALFNNACGVIEDYAKTGGKENVGGTGL